MTEERTRGWGMFAIGWALALLILTLLFNGYLSTRENPNRIGSLTERDGELILRPNAHGHYLVEGHLNGLAVTFLLDTGATDIAVPQNIASLAGLNPGTSILVQTAAGTATAQITQINRMTLGHLVFQDMRGIIIPSDDKTVLLGMSALRDLDFTQSDGTLSLKKPASSI
ncbi:MAG: retropepsin-like aspartic protease family protein [Gammaproteobacteria bacterium]